MDRREMETAAARHSQLRGLQLVPGGLALVVAALANEEVGPFHAWTFPAAVIVAAAAWMGINRFYQDRYGRLTPSPVQQALTVAAAAVAIAVMAGGSALARALDLPVNAIAVCMALVLLVYYASSGGLLRHHVAIAGALLVVGAVPVWNGEDPSNTGLALGGVALMLSGVLDHRAFVRRFGPARVNGA